ncbi:MAG: hypothetical protein IJ793_03625 [Opitutales bacterium]|nr:hypothetical protein [Opitutales bacterium]
MKSWPEPCLLLLSGSVTFTVEWFLMFIVSEMTNESSLNAAGAVVVFLFFLPGGVIAVSFVLIVCCLVTYVASAFLLSNRQQLLFVFRTACCSHFIFMFGISLFIHSAFLTGEADVCFGFILGSPFWWVPFVVVSAIAWVSSISCAFVVAFVLSHERKTLFLKVNGMFEKMMQFPFRVWAVQALISFVFLICAFICGYIYL